MSENKKKISENTENKLLTDDQLEKVSGGDGIPTVTPLLFKRFADDSTNVDGKELYEFPVNTAE